MNVLIKLADTSSSRIGTDSSHRDTRLALRTQSDAGDPTNRTSKNTSQALLNFPRDLTLRAGPDQLRRSTT
jgi:hypothetical protein